VRAQRKRGRSCTKRDDEAMVGKFCRKEEGIRSRKTSSRSRNPPCEVAMDDQQARGGNLKDDNVLGEVQFEG